MIDGVTVLPRAEQDLTEAFLWYQSQLDGLGDKFLLAVDDAIQRICEFPESNRVVSDPIRRQLLRRFPYAAFYIAHPDEIVILAVLHVATDPQSRPNVT